MGCSVYSWLTSLEEPVQVSPSRKYCHSKTRNLILCHRSSRSFTASHSHLSSHFRNKLFIHFPWNFISSCWLWNAEILQLFSCTFDSNCPLTKHIKVNWRNGPWAEPISNHIGWQCSGNGCNWSSQEERTTLIKLAMSQNPVSVAGSIRSKPCSRSFVVCPNKFPLIAGRTWSKVWYQMDTEYSFVNATFELNWIPVM